MMDFKPCEDEKARVIVRELTKAYWMEMETVQNYTANAANLVGIRARRVANAMADDVQDELGHAQKLADRIHTIGGTVPTSFNFAPNQRGLQLGDEPTAVEKVIRGVIEAEKAAIRQYNAIIRLCDGVDFGTQDLCIELLRDEEAHLREFLDYLAEYEAAEGTKQSTAAA